MENKIYKTTPHLVQYQGSKRGLAPIITKFIEEKRYSRLVEPFAGTAAVSLECANCGLMDSFLLNDINEPLIELLRICIDDPERLSSDYDCIWSGQFASGQNPVDYFYKIRETFNSGDTSPANMLFLLARVVKGAIRYNSDGKMNQSCDKRRTGTKPTLIRNRAEKVSKLLKGKAEITAVDYKLVLSQTTPKDIVYMDPPYQGTSAAKDSRYAQGVEFHEFVQELYKLKARGVPFIVSYDGSTGEKKFGEKLPIDLGLYHVLVDAGRSAQATLNGKNERTLESLYISPDVKVSKSIDQIIESLYN